MRTTQNARGFRMGGAGMIAAVVAWIGFGTVCSVAWGQGSGIVAAAKPQAEMQKVSINARKTSLLAVVDLLMKQVHANYTLDSQLQDAPIGAIHLTRVPFRTALEVALKASGKAATYQIESDVYMVVAIIEQPAPGPGQPGFMPGMGQAAPAEEPSVSVLPGSAPDQPRVRLSAQNSDLFTTLNLMFTRAKIQYTLDSTLHKIAITANIDLPFRAALETLLRASGQNLTYKVENDVYSIVPRLNDLVAH